MWPSLRYVWVTCGRHYVNLLVFSGVDAGEWAYSSACCANLSAGARITDRSRAFGEDVFMGNYGKFFASLGAALLIFLVAVSDNGISGEEALIMGIALLGSVGVLLTPNSNSSKEER